MADLKGKILEDDDLFAVNGGVNEASFANQLNANAVRAGLTNQTNELRSGLTNQFATNQLRAGLTNEAVMTNELNAVKTGLANQTNELNTGKVSALNNAKGNSGWVK